jgi:hypothetical protein
MSTRPVFGQPMPPVEEATPTGDPTVAAALAHTAGYRAKAPATARGYYEITIWWNGDDVGRARAGAVLGAIGRAGPCAP